MSRVCFFVAILLQFSAVAQTTLKIPKAEGELSLKTENIKKSSRNQLSLGLENSQFVSASQSYFRQEAAPENTVIGIRIFDERKLSQVFSTQLDLINDFSTQENWNYFKPRDAYVSYRSDFLGNGTVGRKRVVWSSWEDEWQQGVFQPRYMDNKMLPMAAGLTGWFGEFTMGKWRGTIAALPIFIPDMGPHFSVEDNQFVSRNAWFHPPPSQFSIGGSELGDIRYSVQADTRDIVLNPGMAVKIEQTFFGCDTRLAFAYKPMPQVLLGFPSFEKLVLDTGEDYMLIDVAPRVVYQKVASGDFHCQTESPWEWTLSVVNEDPDLDASKTTYTAQQVENATIVALSASRPIGTPGAAAPRFTLGFMKLWGGDSPDKGYFAGNSTLFERRYQYLEALSLGFRLPFYHWQKPIFAEARMIYDSQQNGGSLRFLSGIKLDTNWTAQASMDFIGLVNTGGKVRDGFLNTYRANDRLALGMSYAY